MPASILGLKRQRVAIPRVALPHQICAQFFVAQELLRLTSRYFTKQPARLSLFDFTVLLTAHIVLVPGRHRILLAV